MSGGGDSLALAVLAADWARAQGGSALALIVDHGLRAESASEAGTTVATLARLGIQSRVLTLDVLAPGPGLPARARGARVAALEAACRAAGIIDLLLGHHAADQAETIIMRGLRGSGRDGLAGMAAIAETASIRLLRPLLGVAPGRLRATLVARGLTWAEDPTNADRRFTRARLRAARADADGEGPATRAFAAAAAADGLARRLAEDRIAHWLGQAAVIRSEGFALLPDGPWPAAALAVLLRMIAGAAHLPPSEATAAIARAPAETIRGGVCLAGALLRPAGRLGAGFLICREPAAMSRPVPAEAGARWDGRFQRPANDPPAPMERIGSLGGEAPRFRALSDLPAVVLETLPVYRSLKGDIVAIPALTWPDEQAMSWRRMLFHPRRPAAGAAFGAAVVPARQSCHAGKGRRT